ncbi:MAG TPA: FKBP-type peptidyl-prolyl cis-trans isomerase [Candidatus Saccharimonadales bacterium]|jgi:peptidylprolyl isomerase|nr:FKBP-type peptidyl-prolyl cis-trans isomerase [Candidatus Saccharimonadales bacterium]
MATSNSQRIGIWVIAGVMLVGTLGSFIAMMLAPANAQVDQAELAKQQAAAQQEQQAAAAEHAKSVEPLEGYSATPFDAGSVTELKKEVLVQGTGDVVKDTDTMNVSYFGWLNNGIIFDSSKRNGKDSPIELQLNGVIAGWTEGLKGEKVGSTIKLTIPAAKAYGEQATGSIPANSPLAFIVTINSISKAKN